jgi:hypothetical protein
MTHQLEFSGEILGGKATLTAQRRLATPLRVVEPFFIVAAQNVPKRDRSEGDCRRRRRKSQ